MHSLKNRLSQPPLSVQKTQKPKKEVKVDEEMVQKTLKMVAPKVMRYEKELRQIREELGETTKIIELSPNKQIVINLDDFEKRFDEHLSSQNPSQIIDDANYVNTFVNSMSINGNLDIELSKRKDELN